MTTRLFGSGMLGIVTMCPAAGDEPHEAQDESGSESSTDEPESEGCGQALTTDWFGPYTTFQGLPATRATVIVDGIEREYLLEIPEPYDEDTPYPLVVAFHGNNARMDNAAGQQLGREFEFQAFVAYPQGLPGEGISAIWNLQADSIDVAFFDALVDQIGERACIDRRRIHTWGYSRGGYFANLIACVRGDIVRGSSEAAAGMPLEPEDCIGPVSQFIMRGTEDTIVPEIEPRLAMQAWLELNGCTGASTPAFHPDCKLFDDCSSAASVVYCEVPGAGHVLHQEVPGMQESAVAFLRALQ